MFIRSAEEAELTKNAFANRKMTVVNAMGLFSSNASTKEEKTLNAIDRALSMWNRGGSVYASIGV
jgi:hypothetical protein